MWNCSFPIDGKEIWITNSISDLSLCFPLDSLLDMDEEEILECVHWFLDNGSEIKLINDAHEFNYDPEFFSKDDLRKIKNSVWASKEDRLRVAVELHRRNFPQFSQRPDARKFGSITSGTQVYLIRSETGHYKIGVTKNVKTRLKLLQSASPYKIELIHSFPAKDGIYSERDLHSCFAEKRMEGEWFALDEDDVEFIKGLK